MDSLRLRLRSTPTALRCAFCHGPAPQAELTLCSECRGLTHAACSEDGCPTLGCAAASRVTPSVQLRPGRIRRSRLSARPHETAWNRWLRVVGGATIAMICFGMIGQAFAGGPLRYGGPRPLALCFGLISFAVTAGFLWTLERAPRAPGSDEIPENPKLSED